MRINRFFVKFKIEKGTVKIYDLELLNQLRNVLKLRAGEKIMLCDGAGNEGMAEIKSYSRDYIEAEIVEIGQNSNEPERHVILYCPVLKRENFEWVVQKATEAGIKEIVPVITERTVKLGLRKDRLEKIIKEASEQSGRGVVPILHDPIDFKEAVSSAAGNTNILFDSSGTSFIFSRLEPSNLKPISVWIGPEGGWTDVEIDLAKNYSFKIYSLGKLTLRAETAAIIGSYLVVHN